MSEVTERLRYLEIRIAALEQYLGVIQPPPPIPALASNTPLKTSSPHVIAQSTKLDLSPTTWFQNNWIVLMGIIFITLAAGWSITYAIQFNWLSGQTLCILSAVASLGMYVKGLSGIKNRANHSLLILGLSLFTGSLFMWTHLYSLSSYIALLTTLGLIATTLTYAILNEAEGLCFVAMLMAILAPQLFLGYRIFNGYMTPYIMCLNLYAFCVLHYMNWGRVFTFCWIVTLLFVYPTSAFPLQSIFYMTVLNLLFYVPSVLSAAGLRYQNLPSQGFLVLLTYPFAFLYWMNNVTEYESAYYLLASISSLGLFYISNKNTNRSSSQNLSFSSVLVTGLSALLFTHLFIHSIIYYYDTLFLIDVLLLEILTMVFAAKYVLRAPKVAFVLSYILIVPILFYFSILRSHLEPELSLLSFITASLLIGIIIIYDVSYEHKTTILYKYTFRTLSIITSYFAITFIWSLSHYLIDNPSIARGAALLAYIVISEVLIYLGNLWNNRYMRYGGIAILLLVICRLIFAEAFYMPTIIRIVVFILAGILLMATAWLDKRLGLKELNYGHH